MSGVTVSGASLLSSPLLSITSNQHVVFLSLVPCLSFIPPFLASSVLFLPAPQTEDFSYVTFTNITASSMGEDVSDGWEEAQTDMGVVVPQSWS